MTCRESSASSNGFILIPMGSPAGEGSGIENRNVYSVCTLDTRWVGNPMGGGGWVVGSMERRSYGY